MSNTLFGNPPVECIRCGYIWEPRVIQPKACPDCKRRWPLGKPPVKDATHA